MGTDFSNVIRSTGPSTSMHQSAIRLSLVGLRTSFYTCQRSDCKTLLNTLSKRSVNRSRTVQGFNLFHNLYSTMSPKKVCIIGSGNWGSAIAKLVGENTASHPDLFVEETPIWVYEEVVNGRKLTEIINTDHENVKYLPGRKLPVNVVAVPNIVEAAQDADILIVVLPHQFIARSLAPLSGKLKPGAQSISLVKGFDILPQGGIQLISKEIKKHLDIPVAVLMGANLAAEVADGQFCETTIGCKDIQNTGQMFKALFQTKNFRVTITEDVDVVEMCGALKNIVACAAGFVQGLEYGDNTKSAVIRIGRFASVSLHWAIMY